MLTIQTKLSQLVFVVIFLLLPAWRWGAALALVQLGDDGLDDVLHLLLLGLELLSVGLLHITHSQSAVHLEAQCSAYRVVLEPLDLLVNDLLDLTLLVLAELSSQLFLVADLVFQTGNNQI